VAIGQYLFKSAHPNVYKPTSHSIIYPNVWAELCGRQEKVFHSSF